MSAGGKEAHVAYHDSCYLGRYNDVYDAPRETMLKRALPVDRARGARAASEDATVGCAAAPAAVACGWRSAKGKRINVERTEELLARARTRSPSPARSA